MILLAIAAVAANHVQGPKAALDLCRHALAQKAGGEIATIDVSSSRRRNSRMTIKGRLTAFQGMGPPQPGSASAHHLIRADFDFVCHVNPARVVEASVIARQ